MFASVVRDKGRPGWAGSCIAFKKLLPRHGIPADGISRRYSVEGKDKEDGSRKQVLHVISHLQNSIL